MGAFNNKGDKKLMIKNTIVEKLETIRNQINGITDNQTLDAFNKDYCQILDESNDDFIKNRLATCCKELDLMKSVDYDPRIKTAYEAYCEAICFYDLSKLCDIQNVPETRTSTPDFKIIYNKSDVYVEMKSLSFADGNMNYIKSQESALQANISREEQMKAGKTFIWTEREIQPMAKNGNNQPLREQWKLLRDKIENNIKEKQIECGETILLVDLNQLSVTYHVEDNVPIEKSFNGIGYSSGMLWNLAFAKETDTLFVEPEFEGKPNIDEKQMGFNGILIDHTMLKGVLFAVGRSPDERAFVGFYRYKDRDSNAVQLIQTICSFYNDDRNSWCFNIDKPFVSAKQLANKK